MALVVLALMSHAAYATSIGIYNTGVDGSGLIAAGGNDPYYQVISAPVGAPALSPCSDGVDCGIYATPADPSTMVDLPGYFPFPYWSNNSSTSQWISLSPGNTQAGGNLYSEPGGTYIYQTTFVLPSNFISATLSGMVGTDNYLDGVTLNGNPVGYNGSGWFNPFPGATFSTTSGFVAGVNVLDFDVYNLPQYGGNPEGLRAEVGGSYAAGPVPNTPPASPVPEPSSLVLFGTGLVGLAGAVRRKMKK